MAPGGWWRCYLCFHFQAKVISLSNTRYIRQMLGYGIILIFGFVKKKFKLLLRENLTSGILELSKPNHGFSKKKFPDIT